MLNIFARPSVSKLTDPVGAWLYRRGVTPDAVTVIGTIGTVGSALWFFPRGELFWGSAAITLFVLFDVLDGAIARARGHGTPFGAVLDASCDRAADGALFAGLTWWAFAVAGNHPLAGAALFCLVSAQLISYVKARAEATGLTGDGGVVERAERFILTLVGAGLTGLGVPYVIDVALWVLAAGQAITVAQRMVAVRRSARAGSDSRRPGTS